MTAAEEAAVVQAGEERRVRCSGAKVVEFDRAEVSVVPRSAAAKEPVCGIENRFAYRFAKRAFDIVFSAAVLVCFCWLFAIIAVLIKLDDPKGPVLFEQERVGKNGKTFKMLKFRSMCVDAEERLAELRELNEKTGPVFKIAEDPRITRVGRWLRKLSLDELPQFVNVLRGGYPFAHIKNAPGALCERQGCVRASRQI